MEDIIKKISGIGIVPVVKLDDASDAVPLAKALYNGGIGCAEITYRTAAAEKSIENIVREVPEMLVGAGTVTSCDQIDSAIAAGAKFLVSPGLNEKVVRYAIEKKTPMVPGCSTPSDIERAMELGLNVLKFFPAEQSGGLAMIKALCGPYTSVKFMPTGGINENNYLSYLANEKIVAVGGSWMVNADLIREKKFDEIEKICKETVRKMHGFKLKKMGICCGENIQQAESFSKVLGFEWIESKSDERQNSIVIGVNSVERAYLYLKEQGYETRNETMTSNGKLASFYACDTFAGLAVRFEHN